MEVNGISQISEAFVSVSPRGPQTISGGQESPEWAGWFRTLDTFLSQAQSVVKLDDGLYASRVGSTVTVTGKVKRGKRIDGVFPAAGFSVGGVRFDAQGFMINEGEADEDISVSFVSRR